MNALHQHQLAAAAAAAPGMRPSLLNYGNFHKSQPGSIVHTSSSSLPLELSRTSSPTLASQTKLLQRMSEKEFSDKKLSVLSEFEDSPTTRDRKVSIPKQSHSERLIV